MKELARHETPRVRQAACAVLKRLKQPCPKREGIRVSANPQASPGPPQPLAPADPLADVAIPRYSIYSHFLRMMHLLVASGHRIDGENWPFRAGKPNKTELQAVVAVANSLDRQIADVDQRASRVTLSFRNRANVQLRRNKSMPDAPLQIYTLEALRTAIQVQHMKALQSAIGPQGTARLEAFLGYEFTPAGSYGEMLPKHNQHA